MGPASYTGALGQRGTTYGLCIPLQTNICTAYTSGYNYAALPIIVNAKLP